MTGQRVIVKVGRQSRAETQSHECPRQRCWVGFLTPRVEAQMSIPRIPRALPGLYLLSWQHFHSKDVTVWMTNRHKSELFLKTYECYIHRACVTQG